MKITEKRNPNRKRMMVTIDIAIYNYLQSWAIREKRKTPNELSAVLLERNVEKDQVGETVNVKTIHEEDFEQIKKFIALLVGEDERNGISFTVLGKCLGLDPDKLNDLYLMVLSMREVKKATKETEKPPPFGYEWRLVEKGDAPNTKN